MSNIETLVELMQKLRDPKHGCPWDLKQSMNSLLPHTLEEAYEVAEAIENGCRVELEDELGDLLFQVVFYAQLAREENSFDFESVAAGIVRKLLRRHPHVFPDGTLSSFGQAQELSPDQVVENWEAIKKIEREEKHEKLLASGAKPQREKLGILDDVPKSLPAMDRARKLQKRAAGVGFDWDDMRPVLGKLKEEIAELEEALAGGNQAEVEHELGDVLFATVNLARHTKIEAESALRGCNKRFEARFRYIENELAQRGESVDEKNLEDLDSLWEKAKQSGL